MATKRSAEPATESQEPREHKKQRKGFRVGPDNLPDGQWKRKNQQIKRDLIEKAKLKKDYARLQARQAAAEDPSPDAGADTAAPSAPHPDRQTLIDRPASPTPQPESRFRERKRKPKPAPFVREQRAAEKARAEAEERRKAREEAHRQREMRNEERERFRRAMAKARQGGRNGQRKLGRESTVLLERVKRIVGGG